MRSMSVLLPSILLAACQAAAPSPSHVAASLTPTAAAAPVPTEATPTSPPATGRIAFQRNGDGGGVFTIDPDGRDEQAVLRGVYGTPRWSPDGTQMAVYAEKPDGSVVPVIVRPDGSNYRELATPEGLSCGLGTWSPDGRALALECWNEEDAGQTGIYLAQVSNGTNWRRITSGHGLPGAFSSDGRTLVFARATDEPTSALAIVNADGTNEHTIGAFAILNMPGFLEDGSMYAVVDATIIVVDATGKVLHTIEAPERKIVEARLSSDRQHFVIVYDPLVVVSPGVWRMGLDGDGLEQVVNTNVPGVEEVHPDWRN
jgi:Tol biopolymer transport system component